VAYALEKFVAAVPAVSTVTANLAGVLKGIEAFMILVAVTAVLHW